MERGVSTMVAVVGNVVVMAVTVLLFVAPLHLGGPSESEGSHDRESS